MDMHEIGRRRFVTRCALAVGAVVLPVKFAVGAGPQSNRLEWQSFKLTSHYSALLSAISRMRANANAADPASWSYWVNAHLGNCPHSTAYFLSWHRGFLYHFERQLRTLSGDDGLVLPYWDYYGNPNLPAEFTDPASGNPLYVSRVNTNVVSALTMAPFSGALTNFQRGGANAFEPSLESAPHNPVHDIIGNVMTTMQSPTDPIFWLHHANVDRLWAAWVAAGAGRRMPPQDNPYWSGTLTFSATLTLPRSDTYDTGTSLSYAYQDQALPARLPPVAHGGRIRRAQATWRDVLMSLPPVIKARASAARRISEARFATGGALDVGLDEHSVSISLPVSVAHGKAIAEIARGIASTIAGSSRRYRSIAVVLDDIQVTQAGLAGGYFYNVYLNIPAFGDTPVLTEQNLIGTLGPFEVAGAAHHGGTAQLRYVVTPLLAALGSIGNKPLTVSFVRVNGGNSPKGPVMGISEARLELSTEDGLS